MRDSALRSLTGRILPSATSSRQLFLLLSHFQVPSTIWLAVRIIEVKAVSCKYLDSLAAWQLFPAMAKERIRLHSAWLLFGLGTCSIAAGTGSLLGPPALAEPLVETHDADAAGSCKGPTVSASATSHGKKVLTNYSVIGIPGDGRCLFRAVAHGACVRKGLGAPSESVQRESADALRGKVVDELVRRREETEWFIEGHFDSYTKRMRQPHVWGGEPELLMASHVLRMPITVYMFEKRARGLISIAEYGQEYAKENATPIRVLYHGFGHYDALQLLDHEV
ncbi:hypothetical protein GOP47_0001889 [Adiantum capillus-veneris]|uniref:Ubiquitin thioesterase OTU n=1 Tax=Adiantum capillus-veneris TaxID=13818 RepID=A0A9D4VAF9_ADICA|nr:hypothetical protein GOP47_0001889 [Adiantum capillus-veneris]